MSVTRDEYISLAISAGYPQCEAVKMADFAILDYGSYDLAASYELFLVSDFHFGRRKARRSFWLDKQHQKKGPAIKLEVPTINRKLNVLELFAGTRSIGKAFEANGHNVFSVEWDKQFGNIDLYKDILTLQAEEVIKKFGKPDIIWASPDCSSYSIAAISHHRKRDENGNLVPVSDYAKFCDRVNQHVLCLILALSPHYWFIENPRGGLRKMDFMNGLPRYTVTYCQYGDTRMKPTDIFTNHPDPRFKPPCHNGDPCHISAPRGAKTGTQGLKGSVDRSRIPKALCEHIVKICEEGMESEAL